MKKREDTKTLHGKYSCTFRLNREDRNAAYDFADRCGKSLSASALYVSSLKIVLEILSNQQKLEAVAPHSEELQRIAKLREDNADQNGGKMSDYSRGWDDGYQMGYSRQPKMNRDYLQKRIEKLEKELAHYKELAGR